MRAFPEHLTQCVIKDFRDKEGLQGGRWQTGLHYPHYSAISWEENRQLFFTVPAVTVSKIELVRTQPSRLNDGHYR
jgi:hypothetical protein